MAENMIEGPVIGLSFDGTGYRAGGSIGFLAINGTVNDLAMSGAIPLYLSVGFVLEEGFLLEDLERILEDMKTASLEAAVQVVTGDTKVVEKGAADKIFINTAGTGVVLERAYPQGHHVKAGVKVIVNGPIGDHGIAIMTQRKGLVFDTPIESDTAPLNHIVVSSRSFFLLPGVCSHSGTLPVGVMEPS